MCVYIHICICICIYIYIYIFIHINISYLSLSIYIYIYVHTVLDSLQLALAEAAPDVPDEVLLRDKNLYTTTNKCLQALLKIMYTVF